MILEVSCLGEVLECGLQERVPEEGSGSGFWPRGQNLGSPSGDSKADLKSFTGARARKTVNKPSRVTD